VAEDGLRAVDHAGRAVDLPRPFIEGRRTDGSPNLSHAWVRTVDGVQAGTWAQVHLLGNAALERFTGYTGQSRSRHATHTWNVTRLPDIDHGGVLADQRTPDKEVLTALGRVPDTGFAVHDTPSRLADLLAERPEHRAVLATRPPERFRHLRDAERKLDYALKNREQARWRLENARRELAELGGLSQLGRRGRHDKAALLDRIDRFQGDVGRAEHAVAGCEAHVGERQTEFAQEVAWEVQHGWRTERLDAIETELSGIRGDHLAPDDPLLSRDRPKALLRRQSSERPRHEPRNSSWERRLADIAAPPLPARDAGLDLGIDLGP
jgi:hypothetical protein